MGNPGEDGYVSDRRPALAAPGVIHAGRRSTCRLQAAALAFIRAPWRCPTESANMRRMLQEAYAIGVDFGTASARTLLLDLRSGNELAVSEFAYPHGVIVDILPETGERLPSDWALHEPSDYMVVLERGIASVLAEVPGAASHVIGIGVDATCCTVLPVTGCWRAAVRPGAVAREAPCMGQAMEAPRRTTSSHTPQRSCG